MARLENENQTGLGWQAAITGKNLETNGCCTAQAADRDDRDLCNMSVEHEYYSRCGSWSCGNDFGLPLPPSDGHWIA